MLPEVLSEIQCSLRAGSDRLAVSVIFLLDPNSLEILHTWYGRTVIQSSYEIPYEQAQNILGGRKPPARGDGPEGEGLGRVRDTLQMLHRIAMDRQRRRKQAGAVALQSVELKFETGDDLRMTRKEELDMCTVVAELMILANSFVAKRLFDRFPNAALLRNHQSPTMSKLESLEAIAVSCGFDFRFSSNKELAESLEKVGGNPQLATLLRSLSTRAMTEAKYIRTEYGNAKSFYHYGLAAEYYTHFTSPIRRYADLVVHRQLLADIGDAGELYKGVEMDELSDHLNAKTRDAREAQRSSSDFYLKLFLAQRVDEDTFRRIAGEVELEEGPGAYYEGIVYKITPSALGIHVPAVGLKGQVGLYDDGGKSLLPSHIVLEDGSRRKLATAEVEEDSHVTLHTAGTSVRVGLCSVVSVYLLVDFTVSHAHYPRVEMRLHGVGKAEQDSGAPRGKAALRSYIAERGKTEVPRAGTTNLTRLLGDPAAGARARGAKRERETLYDLFDQFDRLTLSDGPFRSQVR